MYSHFCTFYLLFLNIFYFKNFINIILLNYTYKMNSKNSFLFFQNFQKFLGFQIFLQFNL